jgi:ankyrin repeat protein
MVEMLASHGVDLNARSLAGNTALMVAAQQGHGGVRCS